MLSMVGAVFLVPIALLVFVFIEQSMKDIRFAEREISGSHYLAKIWPTFVGLSRSSDPTSVEALSAPEFDSLFGTAEASRALASVKSSDAKFAAAATAPGK